MQLRREIRETIRNVLRQFLSYLANQPDITIKDLIDIVEKIKADLHLPKEDAWSVDGFYTVYIDAWKEHDKATADRVATQILWGYLKSNKKALRGLRAEERR